MNFEITLPLENCGPTIVGTFWRPPTGVRVTRVSSPLSLCFIRKALEGLRPPSAPLPLFTEVSLVSEKQLFDRLSFISFVVEARRPGKKSINELKKSYFLWHTD